MIRKCIERLAMRQCRRCQAVGNVYTVEWCPNCHGLGFTALWTPTATAWLSIALYLLAAVAANTVVSMWGPWALTITALVMIPLDLTTRDLLHDRWHGNWLWPRMFALVLSGSALSYLTASPAVCVASAASFCLAGLTDAAAYAALSKHSKLVKMNGSNVASAIVDSVAFPLIAFSVFIPSLSATQAVMKIGGGVVWSFVLVRMRTRKVAR